MHLNVPPVVVNKLRKSSSGRPVDAEPWLDGWMKLTRVDLRAHDHSISKFEVLYWILTDIFRASAHGHY